MTSNAMNPTGLTFRGVGYQANQNGFLMAHDQQSMTPLQGSSHRVPNGMEQEPLMKNNETEDEDESSDGLGESGREARTRRFVRKALLWGLPASLLSFSMLISMWLLHISTYYYVQLMDRAERAYLPNPQFKDKSDGILSPGLYPEDLSYGSLQDPLEAWLGFRQIPLETIDIVAAAFPVIWFLVVVLKVRDLQHWTKVILCHSLLGLLKGVFAAVTIIPDSIGWQHCKARLGPTNLEFLRHGLPEPGVDGYLTNALALLRVELFGPKGNRLLSGMRFCADMLYSGHTYTTTLYILAILEMLDWWLAQKKTERKRHVIIMTVLYVVCTAEQVTEFVLVILNRFHYTVDVFQAVLFTFLWYTSAPISVLSKTWASLDGPTQSFEECESSRQIKELGKIAKTRGFGEVHIAPKFRSEGDIWVPACCCYHGRHHLVSDADLWKMGADEHENRIHHHPEGNLP